jgi:hypothetical protein
MSQSLSSVYIHLVFSTRRRKPFCETRLLDVRCTHLVPRDRASRPRRGRVRQPKRCRTRLRWGRSRVNRFPTPPGLWPALTIQSNTFPVRRKVAVNDTDTTLTGLRSLPPKTQGCEYATLGWRTKLLQSFRSERADPAGVASASPTLSYSATLGKSVEILGPKPTALNSYQIESTSGDGQWRPRHQQQKQYLLIVEPHGFGSLLRLTWLKQNGSLCPGSP